MITLKLAVPAAALASLARHPTLQRLQEGTATSERLHTTYFDTPQLDFASHGVALRLRAQGARRLQAVTTLGAALAGDAAAITVRREWEWPLDPASGTRPDLGLLAAEGVREVVPLEALSSVEPIFSTDFQRTALLVRPDPLSAIELSLDTGEIRCGAAHRPITEIELQLKAGTIGALFDLALTLQRLVPLRLVTASRAAIGLALLRGEVPVPARAAPLALTPLTTVAEGFRHILRNGISHIVGTEAALLTGSDAEAVHQMRVAVRRLRSALGLFADCLGSAAADDHRDQLGWLAARLGPARDWDVLRDQLFGGYAERHAGVAGLRGLAVLIDATRATARAGASEAVRSPRYTQLVLSLAGWLESGRWRQAPAEGMPGQSGLDGPLLTPASAWLGALRQRVRKAGRRLSRLDEEQRHRLRIRVKRLRYASEFLRGLYPAEATRPFLERLEELQDRIGELNDLSVAQRSITALVDEAEPATAAAGRRFAAWLGRRARKRAPSLVEAWQAFDRAPAFWE